MICSPHQAAKQSKNPSWWHVSQAKKRSNPHGMILVDWGWCIGIPHGQSLLEGRIPKFNQPGFVSWLMSLMSTWSVKLTLPTWLLRCTPNSRTFAASEWLIQLSSITASVLLEGLSEGKTSGAWRLPNSKTCIKQFEPRFRLTSKSQCYQLDVTKHQSSACCVWAQWSSNSTSYIDKLYLQLPKIP